MYESANHFAAEEEARRLYDDMRWGLDKSYHMLGVEVGVNTLRVWVFGTKQGVES